jgi:hypothetical protein
MTGASAFRTATDLPEAIAALVGPEERLLWSGRPRPSVFLLRGLPNIAYGITWSVLGAYWYHGSGGIGRYSAFEGWWRLTPLFSLPFILAGFSFFFYPIRLGARARRTWYLVTDRRVLTAELVRGQPVKVHVFRAEDLAALHVVKRFDGLEDVILSKRTRENPHLKPRLEHGFFGLVDGTPAVQAIQGSARI